MHALQIQLLEELKKINNTQLQSIFIGGGTPSSVEVSLYKPIFKILRNYINKQTEITFEANPNSASIEWLYEIKNLGANRISFGIQSFDDKKLKFLGRNHNKDQAIEAIHNAKEVGFEHINMDIIYDTAIDTKKLLENDLNIIQMLPIDHISAYSLTIEEGTKFFKKPQVKIENIDYANFLFQRLQDLGFDQYEISNFAKNINAQSKHNFGYWQKIDYLGVGAGAVGAMGNKRYYPQKDVQLYIQNPCKYEDIEDINKDDVIFETIFLGLRSDVGVALNIFNEQQKKNINILLREEKIKQVGDRIYNLNFLLTDEIVLFID